MGFLSGPAAALRGLGSGAWLIGRAGRGLAPELLIPDPLTRRRLAAAVETFVWRPLPLLALLAGLTGAIVGLLLGQVLERLHFEAALEPAAARTLAREVIPLTVGVFAAGRVSVEIAARLGAMRLSRELDALELLGLDPVRYVLTPVLLGVTVAAPIHQTVAVLCAWAAAGLVLQLDAVTPWPQYVALTVDGEAARAALAGAAKAAVFSLLAAGVGATVGARAVSGPADIARSATAAFTWGLLAVFTAAAVWAALG